MRDYGENNPGLVAFLKTLKARLTYLNDANTTTKHGKSISRIRTIHDLARKTDGSRCRLSHQRPDVPFDGANADQVWVNVGGNMITVRKYFETRYGVLLHAAHLPVVNVGKDDRPVYVPAELCEVLPDQPCNIRLTPTQTANMIRFAVREPKDNAESITQTGINYTGLMESTNPKLAVFGVKVGERMLTVPARILQCPQIKYAREVSVTTKSGGWNMQGIQFSTPKEMPRWACLVVRQQGKSEACSFEEHKYQIQNSFTEEL